MSEIEIEAKTVEEAIQEGLKQLDCSRDKVEIKILNEGASGLFGLMGNKPAKVRMATKDGSASDLGLAQESVKKILNDLLKMMSINYTAITVSLMGGRVLADIKSPDSSIIIGKNGQALEALESIVNLILNRDEKTRVKVSIDSEGYRLRQEERLQELARQAADQVKKSGKTFNFDPMPARDRRIIHLALKSDSALETLSEGEGMFRKVVVKLK
ncbi:MAG: hypothetical protein A2204_05640 [Elusimicrobia bacterium RIFOXYA1_FULL_47_7]|nr:MAG: hypothetical protein A2278_05430 [Elusimicrobia bacterium RIFOXYA12_FULL_49_49]OGS09745.1 MAG: hypothetical protein A2204_05640 [Elusimicrobia bacterium RIFOXYA1_FULL_47_7]OGS10768.1 MAG: hypothetical protein A2386_05115 [Elusimicrobia bacterium RIFOXYB1_FULL_48_9]OGS16482.1 MAG: hypothetical protein A2251_06630 [Elusimicrobia bacterium RIFOXYA2_FULL_47_53]OGS26664.1 MAG: hypothetical protein A2339_01795 [Elusimicrobia bacterium RIFOXYB12_FULL_50_12]OGS31219.1 MAG: hypothetical protein